MCMYIQNSAKLHAIPQNYLQFYKIHRVLFKMHPITHSPHWLHERTPKHTFSPCLLIFFHGLELSGYVFGHFRPVHVFSIVFGCLLAITAQKSQKWLVIVQNHCSRPPFWSFMTSQMLDAPPNASFKHEFLFFGGPGCPN